MLNHSILPLNHSRVLDLKKLTVFSLNLVLVCKITSSKEVNFFNNRFRRVLKISSIQYIIILKIASESSQQPCMKPSNRSSLLSIFSLKDSIIEWNQKIKNSKLCKTMQKNSKFFDSSKWEKYKKQNIIE
ncbi:hypothetical protein BpHYR1_032980 [Brachionus plicatilis]|uniref:Uncharacterized protein n=1 Tax=Brachionus plicatilis TaxID=10195 RepID=A0A3M7RF02_BRAPC|nr:hypothetical protein BpHYR1_032980 [Brachionus plicatilis]